jgi:hypothetical protein
MLAQVAAFISGLAGGLLVNWLWDRRRRIWFTLTARRHRIDEVLGFNPEEVGLYWFNRWSPVRPLAKSNHQVVHTMDRSASWDLFDEAEWNSLRDAFQQQGKGGNTCSLRSFEIDHHEHERGHVFRLVMSTCDYSEHLATVAYLEKHAEALGELARLMDRRHFAELAKSTPPSSVKVCVSVVSPTSNVLAVRRSGSVDMKRGEWTLGVNETMRSPSANVPGSPGEDLFDLCERALREELGLEPHDYGEILISWIGYDLRTLQVKLWAQVRAHIPERMIFQKMDAAHSVFEADQRVWVPFRREALNEIVSAWRPDAQGRTWSDSAPLTAQELWRMRSLLA